MCANMHGIKQAGQLKMSRILSNLFKKLYKKESKISKNKFP